MMMAEQEWARLYPALARLVCRRDEERAAQSFLEMLSACSQDDLSAAMHATLSEPEADGSREAAIGWMG